MVDIGVVDFGDESDFRCFEWVVVGVVNNYFEYAVLVRRSLWPHNGGVP